jgi:hypothetical protein
LTEREKTRYKPNKDTDRSDKNQDRVKLRSRENGKAENKSNDKSASKYCTFHKSNSHDTSECKAKKCHDLRQSNKNNQEVNVITPLPDNFCYETAASKKSLLLQSMLDLMTSSSQTITMGTYNHQLKILM